MTRLGEFYPFTARAGYTAPHWAYKEESLDIYSVFKEHEDKQ